MAEKARRDKDKTSDSSNQPNDAQNAAQDETLDGTSDLTSQADANPNIVSTGNTLPESQDTRSDQPNIETKILGTGSGAVSPEPDANTLPSESALPPDVVQGDAATGKLQMDSSSEATGDFTDAQQFNLDPDGTKLFESGVDAGVTGDFTVSQRLPAAHPGMPTKVGSYDILGVLGRGGMGVVYRAKQKKLGREVALKMILSGAHASGEQLQRFISEAQAVAHLQHPNIVQIFEVSEERGLPFFSLEFVDGQSLDDLLGDRMLADREAAKLTMEICRAMQYAHDHAILHRDLKPANVLLAVDGTPKITDFGLAKNLEDTDESSSTRTGTVMGTPSYMSPEQASGKVHELGPATDQYSLGAMLYEFLTGRPPFIGAKPVETIMQVVRDEPVPPRQIRGSCPVDLETICLKALQKDPHKRYASCNAMADDLQRYLDGVPIEARPVSNLERAWRWCRRNPTIAIASAAAMLMMVFATTVSTWSYFTVSAKNREIAAERDYAQEQETIAKIQEQLAKDQQALAEAREKVAREQSKLALDSLQFVQTNVDNELKTLAGMSDVRLRIMRAMAEKWHELEIELTSSADDATGERGEAMATLMASRARTAEALLQLGEVQEADDIYAELIEQANRRIEIMEGVDAARFNAAFLYVQRAATQSKLNPDPKVALDLNLVALNIIENIREHPKPKPYDPESDEKTSEEIERERNDLDNRIDSVHESILKGLGAYYLGQGELGQAAEYFSQAYAVGVSGLEKIRNEPSFENLSIDQQDTLTAGRQLALDTSGLALAYIYLRLGRTEESIERYEAAIKGRREIAERRPNFAALQHGLAGFLGNYGNAYLWLDRPEDARSLLEESLQIFVQLTSTDPKNARYRSDLSTAHYRVGTYWDVTGETELAKEHFLKSMELRRELVELSDNETNKQRLMLSLARCGQMDQARAISDEFRSTEVQNGELHLERARALAQLSRHTNTETEKTAIIDDALNALERAVDEGFADPFRISAEQDLDPLHANSRFDQVLASLKSSQSEQGE